ncbi:13190_t:CDS:2 [Dentiscutata erythropus]|uniref:13190_t:CDS:1 n=1 Tax=Dentiscutata erythropus TaxID=1348616 RepID=A0A9N9C0C5_9GLOM|nr:13190_t:CDS:2 [Dentiscutata erythropus]
MILVKEETEFNDCLPEENANNIDNGPTISTMFYNESGILYSPDSLDFCGGGVEISRECPYNHFNFNGLVTKAFPQLLPPYTIQIYYDSKFCLVIHFFGRTFYDLVKGNPQFNDCQLEADAVLNIVLDSDPPSPYDNFYIVGTVKTKTNILEGATLTTKFYNENGTTLYSPDPLDFCGGGVNINNECPSNHFIFYGLVTKAFPELLPIEGTDETFACASAHLT